jgi:hypothetical protein
MAMRFWCLLLLAGIVAACSDCGSLGVGNSPGQPVPQLGHVFLVVEENHSYSDVIGNPVMPYLNSLVPQASLAKQYFANGHPSIPNYFMLTTGQLITTDDNFSGTVNADNVVRELVASGKTWKSYAQSLPAPGYTGPDSPPYLKHHNPFAYFSDVLNNPSQAGNLVPIGQLSADLTNNQLPNYSFIVPDAQHDAHDCPGGGSNCADSQRLSAADQWLQANIDPILKSSIFHTDGLMVIVFDESEISDISNGGGHVPMILLSPRAKAGFQSTAFYQHQSTLRTTLEALGVSNLPGASASATRMGEFFQ